MIMNTATVLGIFMLSLIQCSSFIDGGVIKVMGIGNGVPCFVFENQILWTSVSSTNYTENCTTLFDFPHFETNELVKSEVENLVANNPDLIACMAISEVTQPKLEWVVQGKGTRSNKDDQISGNYCSHPKLCDLGNKSSFYQSFHDSPDFSGSLWITVQIFNFSVVNSSYSVICKADIDTMCMDGGLEWRENLQLRNQAKLNPPTRTTENGWNCGHTYEACRDRVRFGLDATRCLWSNLTKTFFSECAASVANLACATSYNVYNSSESLSSPVTSSAWTMISKEECYLMKLKCRMFWRLYDRMYSRSLSWWPRCEDFPSVNRNNSDISSTSCYGEGIYYVGTEVATSGGYKCQSWESQCPVSHSYFPQIYPEISRGGEWCGNPGVEKTQPWCFLKTPVESGRTWDFCSIPRCPSSRSDRGLGAVIGIGIFATLCTATLILCYLVKKELNNCTTSLFSRAKCTVLRKHDPLKKGKDSFLEPVPYSTNRDDCATCHLTGETTEMNVEDEIRIVRSELRFRNTDYYDGLTADMSTEFPRNRLKFIDRIDQGRFCGVFCASVDGYKDYVAVKMANDSDIVAEQSLKHEVSILRKPLIHANVIRLLGAGLSSMPVFLVYELMPYGDIRTFLRHLDQKKDPPLFLYDHVTLTANQRLRICRQIAEGATYISKRSVVHRDIACRNCLLGKQLLVKIGDFGLAQEVGKGGKYVGERGEELPTRWMSPEALRTRIFSSKSDVWAYGVTLWEVYSHAMLPYFGFSNSQVVDFVAEGQRLDKPPLASDFLYSLMQSCWTENPKDRVDFLQILSVLDDVADDAVVLM